MGCFVGVQFDALGLPGLIPHTSTSPLRVLHCSVCVSSRELYPRLERQADVHGGAVGSSGQNVEGALAQECLNASGHVPLCTHTHTHTHTCCRISPWLYLCSCRCWSWLDCSLISGPRG
uniref:Uncharacterized protein n=1 Tax=Astyanax mexicanus TaxID=7994 RepID=A0A3B1JVX6_ASTMX